MAQHCKQKYLHRPPIPIWKYIVSMPNLVLVPIHIASYCDPLGRSPKNKECLLSGIAQISSPPPPNSGNLIFFFGRQKWCIARMTETSTYDNDDGWNDNYDGDGAW